MSLKEYWTTKKVRLAGLVIAGVALLAFFANSVLASDLQVSGGITNASSWDLTKRDAWAAEVAYVTDKWKLGLGYVDEQTSEAEYVGDYGYATAQRLVPLWNVGDFGTQLGVGLMVRTNGNNVDYLLPQVWNFAFSAGITYYNLSLEVQHFSNLGFKAEDRGQNMLLVGYKF
jgi:hypothetical protein